MKRKPFPYTLDPAAIPTAKVLKIAGDSAGCVLYACPDSCWREHHDAWCRAYGHGNKLAPQPMPYGHLMFARPASYACIPYGCTDPATIRAAHEADVRQMLDGWDRDLTREELEAIVNRSVEARMNGEDRGAGSFLACIWTAALR